MSASPPLAAQRRFFAVTFHPGPRWQADDPMRGPGVADHAERLRRAGAEGSVVFAGPFADASGGLAVVRCEGEADVRRFVDEDPALQSGALVADVRRVRPIVGAPPESPPARPDAPEATPSDIAARDAALNQYLVEGRFDAALEAFFADDAAMAEVDQPPTSGKAANRRREGLLLAAAERIAATLVSSAVAGPVSFSEWTYEIVFRSGRRLAYRQVARRHWRDGRVVREDYFHADFPPWFVDEIRAGGGRT